MSARSWTAAALCRFTSPVLRWKSGRGLPQSRTLARDSLNPRRHSGCRFIETAITAICDHHLDRLRRALSARRASGAFGSACPVCFPRFCCSFILKTAVQIDREPRENKSGNASFLTPASFTFRVEQSFLATPCSFVCFVYFAVSTAFSRFIGRILTLPPFGVPHLCGSGW